MNIRPITNQIVWTTFLNNCDSPSFLQSWEWGSLQEKLGYDVLRLGLYGSVIPAKAGIQSNNNLVAVAQVIKIRSKRANMLFVPHGPTMKNSNDKILTQRVIDLWSKIIKELQNYLIDIAQTEGFAFIRIAPILHDSRENRAIFSNLGFRTSPIYMHAERVWELDITKPEEQLLAEMRKTTRYSIRKGEKEGVIIEKYPMINDQRSVNDQGSILNEFWQVYEKTAEREGFTPFSKKFIQHEFNEFNMTGNALILLGKIGVEHPGIPSGAEVRRAPTGKDARQNLSSQQNTDAGALIVFTQSTAFYHQGASLHSKVPVTYLMQWKAIKEAKRRGCTRYSFWGTLQPGRSPKSWGGLSLFKQGFGGFQTDYVPTQDYIVSWKYWLSYVYELYLKWKRGV